MPIVQPGSGKISMAVEAAENIQGVLKADVNIVRKVSGINLPIRCYLVDGENVGSWFVDDFSFVISFGKIYFTVPIRIYVP